MDGERAIGPVRPHLALCVELEDGNTAEEVERVERVIVMHLEGGERNVEWPMTEAK